MYSQTEQQHDCVSDKGIFWGYASVFNRVDQQKDIIAPGSFAESLKRRKVALLWQHNTKDPIGKILSLTENSFGLLMTAQLNLDLLKGREVYSMIKKGIINSLSIGYRVVTSRRDKRSRIRIITKIDLWEVSLVTFPANDRATISNIKGGQPSEPDMKNFDLAPPPERRSF
ncbi:HK97 family phage prohead protease [Candidatus Anaplasma sp. TIGMIC]|uniref:HK97 family phage prohead protease n=1 Tax=Candidatus Anaplasma sp. TIGMIC TaxID=3020713 RepID=UPI00232F4833|nr:HK97 family phage prohead protease [Candidatus Anaplasma sp. TIGMIC]MDB1135485.1 HK97 family phage prohead protease [Candidatus Anaplasma sp. TIGMIC]